MKPSYADFHIKLVNFFLKQPMYILSSKSNNPRNAIIITNRDLITDTRPHRYRFTTNRQKAIAGFIVHIHYSLIDNSFGIKMNGFTPDTTKEVNNGWDIQQTVFFHHLRKEILNLALKKLKENSIDHQYYNRHVTYERQIKAIEESIRRNEEKFKDAQLENFNKADLKMFNDFYNIAGKQEIIMQEL